MRKILLAAALVIAGCAQVPMAEPQADQVAKAFAPPEAGRGALYVYRSGLMGVARPIDVSIVGGARAELGPNTYVRLEGPPGPVDIVCRIGDSTGRRQVLIDPGRIRYVEVSMTVASLLPGCDVTEASPDQARNGILGGRRVAVQ